MFHAKLNVLGSTCVRVSGFVTYLTREEPAASNLKDFRHAEALFLLCSHRFGSRVLLDPVSGELTSGMAVTACQAVKSYLCGLGTRPTWYS